MLPKIIKCGFEALNLQYFFTAGTRKKERDGVAGSCFLLARLSPNFCKIRLAGADEVKAWTIRKGTKAPEAAGKIHTGTRDRKVEDAKPCLK